MELERARTLLTELADGVDPLTGECLPSDSVCNRPEIIRALHCVLQHTAGGRKRPSPPNAGKPWTEADDSTLLQMLISYAGILIFTGLTIYDTQSIKRLALTYHSRATDEGQKVAIMGALTLYLDFINIFIYLLRLFGDRK